MNETKELIQKLYTITNLGAERPVHKCGYPMVKDRVTSGGRQRWKCTRASCSEAQRRYKQSEKYREKERRYKQSEKGRASYDRSNAKRVFVGRYYVGHAPTAEAAAQLNDEARAHFTNPAESPTLTPEDRRFTLTWPQEGA